EKENRVTRLCFLEDAIQTLLSFTDVFAHNLREIDLVEIQQQLVCNHFGGHGLSRSGMARKECTKTSTERELSPKPPVAINNLLVSVPGTDFTELGYLIGR